MKRRQLLSMGLGVSLVGTVWYKPIVNAVLLPAHAQTSAMATSITAQSLDADNPFARFILIVDSADTVLANCGTSGGIATANSLAAGNYRVFADSNGPQTQRITVSTDTESREINVPTNTGTCNFLVATITLPSGAISPANGEQVSGSWDCNSNPTTSCAG